MTTREPSDPAISQRQSSPQGEGSRSRASARRGLTRPIQPGRTPKIPKVILLIESSRAAGRALLCGIAQYAHHHGPWSFYWETRGLETQSPVLPSVEADGVIMRDTEAVEAVRASGLPLVVVAHRHAEVPGAVNVITDSEAIGRMGAEHLAACGMRQFAFCGYTDCSWSDIRRAAFVTWLKAAGFPADTFSVRAEITGAPWGNQRQAIASWLRSLPRPLGLMACNDDLGHEVIAACKLVGLEVPDDVAVVGADNDEVVCGLADPPLSSVAINFERAGYEAAEVLARMMRADRRPARRILVRATHVVPRRSTDTLAVDDPSVVKALRFIRDRAHGGVSVGEVAQASGVSRRALEKRFRRWLGRSVLHEIRRLRADQIARLLVDTDLPVAEIASRLGFADVQHVARYFRAAKQVSPLAYRKAHGRKEGRSAG